MISPKEFIGRTPTSLCRRHGYQNCEYDLLVYRTIENKGYDGLKSSSLLGWKDPLLIFSLYQCSKCGRYALSLASSTGGSYSYDIRVGQIEGHHHLFFVQDVPEQYRYMFPFWYDDVKYR